MLKVKVLTDKYSDALIDQYSSYPGTTVIDVFYPDRTVVRIVWRNGIVRYENYTNEPIHIEIQGKYFVLN